MSRTRVTLAALAIALTASGCAALTGSGSGGETRQLESPTATGPRIGGSGYSYRVPKNWGKPGRTVPGFDPDSAAFDLRDTDEFTDNINVIASPTGRISPDEIEDGVQEELERTGATDVEVHDRVVIAGEESAHVSAGSSVNDVDYIVEQYYVSNDDQTFVVTFSFSPDVPAKKRTRVTDSTLSTWTWNA